MNGAAFAFKAEADSSLQLYAFDAAASSPQWLPSGFSVPSSFAGWVAVSVRLDFSDQTAGARQLWDVSAGKVGEPLLLRLANLAGSPLAYDGVTTYTLADQPETPPVPTCFDALEALTTNPAGPDADGDGMLDQIETFLGLDPAENDRTAVITYNGQSWTGIDAYADFVSHMQPEDDPDDDGLSNAEEERFGTNPFDPDSDHDDPATPPSQFTDRAEVERGTDPTNPNSRDTTSDDLMQQIMIRVGAVASTDFQGVFRARVFESFWTQPGGWQSKLRYTLVGGAAPVKNGEDVGLRALVLPATSNYYLTLERLAGAGSSHVLEVSTNRNPGGPACSSWVEVRDPAGLLGGTVSPATSGGHHGQIAVLLQGLPPVQFLSGSGHWEVDDGRTLRLIQNDKGAFPFQLRLLRSNVTVRYFGDWVLGPSAAFYPWIASRVLNGGSVDPGVGHLLIPGVNAGGVGGDGEPRFVVVDELTDLPLQQTDLDSGRDMVVGPGGGGGGPGLVWMQTGHGCCCCCESGHAAGSDPNNPKSQTEVKFSGETSLAAPSTDPGRTGRVALPVPNFPTLEAKVERFQTSGGVDGNLFALQQEGGAVIGRWRGANATNWDDASLTHKVVFSNPGGNSNELLMEEFSLPSSGTLAAIKRSRIALLESGFAGGLFKTGRLIQEWNMTATGWQMTRHEVSTTVSRLDVPGGVSQWLEVVHFYALLEPAASLPPAAWPAPASRISSQVQLREARPYGTLTVAAGTLSADPLDAPRWTVRTFGSNLGRLKFPAVSVDERGGWSAATYGINGRTSSVAGMYLSHCWTATMPNPAAALGDAAGLALPDPVYDPAAALPPVHVATSVNHYGPPEFVIRDEFTRIVTAANDGPTTSHSLFVPLTRPISSGTDISIWQVGVEEQQTVALSAGSSGILLTHSYSFSGGDDEDFVPFRLGKSKSVLRNDGTGSTTTYSYEASGELKVESASGQSSQPLVAGANLSDSVSIIDGTVHVSHSSPNGVVRLRESYDIASNLRVGRTIYTDSRNGTAPLTEQLNYTVTEESVDAAGAAVSSTTRTYDFGKLTASSSSDGVSSSYSHDALGREISRTEIRGGKTIHHLTSHSLDGLTVTSSRQAQGAAAQLLATRISSPLGDVSVYVDHAANAMSLTHRLFDQNIAGTESFSIADAGFDWRSFLPFTPGPLPSPVVSGSLTVSHLDGSALATAEMDGSAEPLKVLSWHARSHSSAGLQHTVTNYGAANNGSPSTASSLSCYGRTVQSWIGSGNATSNNTGYSYDVAGRQLSTTDQAGLTRINTYNGRGEPLASGLDVDQDGQLYSLSLDRYTETASDVVTDPALGVCRRVRTYGLLMPYGSYGVDSRTLLSTSLVAVTGLASRTDYPDGTHESQSRTTGATSIARSQARDGTATETTTINGVTAQIQELGSNDAVLATRTFTYDSLLRLVSESHSRTGTTTYTYYSSDKVHTVTAPAPGPGTAPPVTTYTYDSFGRIASVARSNAPAADAVTTYQYYPSGQLKYQSGDLTYPVAYAYDYQGRMTSMTTWKSDAEAGNLSAPSAATTQWVYDANGQLWKKIYPAFDENGDGQTTETAREVVYTYDDIGRLATRTWARGAVTSYIYHPYTGDLIYTDYADNAVTRDLEYRYDRAGRPIEVNEGTLTGTPEFYLSPEPLALAESVVSLSGNNLPVWLTASPVAVSFLGLNSLGILGWVPDDSSSNYSSWTWIGEPPALPLGSAIVESDVFSESGETHLYDYFAGSGLLHQEKVLGRLTQPLAVTYDPNAEDSVLPTAGQPLGYSATLGETEQLNVAYGWAGNGRLGTLTAKVPHPANAGQMLPHAFAYTYDLPGDAALLHKITGPKTETEYLYQPGRDALQSVINRSPAPDVNTPFGWAGSSGGAPFTPSRHDYALNPLGQRTQHAQHHNYSYYWNIAPVVTDYFYNPKGEVGAANRTFPNLAQTPRSEVPGQTGDVSWFGPLEPGQGNELYSYDAIGNRQWATRNFPAAPSAPASGTPSAVPTASTGSLEQSTSYAAGPANTYRQITPSGHQPPPQAVCSYDADGNLLSDGTWTYAWDGENRLLEVQPVSPQVGDLHYSYRYDYRSRRVRRVARLFSGSWFELHENAFQYDGWNLIVEYHENLNQSGPEYNGINRYVWGQDVSGTLQGAGGVGGLLMAQMQGCHYWNGCQVTTPQVLYYQYDGNGNISSLLDSSGNHLCHLRYDSFGNRLTQPLAGHWYPWVFNQPWGFSTKWTDDTTFHWYWPSPAMHQRHQALCYYGYRHYTPKTGRWLGRDFAQSEVNLFVLLSNCSLDDVDIFGLERVGISLSKKETDDDAKKTNERLTNEELTIPKGADLKHGNSYDQEMFATCGNCDVTAKFTRAEFGQFKYQFRKTPVNGAIVNLHFNVDGTCGDKIEIIQAVRQIRRKMDKDGKWTGEVEGMAPKGNPALNSRDSAGSHWMIDASSKAGKTPYYSRSAYGNFRGSSGFLVDTPAVKRSEENYAGKEFLSCLLCSDTGHVIACVHWGYLPAPVLDEKGRPVAPEQYTSEPLASTPSLSCGRASTNSGAFEAIKQWNSTYNRDGNNKLGIKVPQ